MVIAFSDTETSGLYPIDSAPFELAFMIYKDVEKDGIKTHQLVEEKVFNLNPLQNEILYHEDAYKTHGVTEETIRTFSPAAEVVPEIVDFLKKYCPEEKMIFAGYKSQFDYDHIASLLFRYGYSMSDYFNGRLIDVLELVKRYIHLLPRTENHKLGTMTKALGIEHEDKHSALSDIRATRRLYEIIYLLSKKEIKG